MSRDKDKVKEKNKQGVIISNYWKSIIPEDIIPPIKERICKCCGELKECKCLYKFTTKGIPIYNSICIDCAKLKKAEFAKRTRAKYREKDLQRQNLKNKTNKQRAINYLGGKCNICGYSKCMAALVFHHKDITQKEFTIGHILQNSWETIQQELDKCILLCANCHGEVHEENESRENARS